jgi:hypothetical protein
MESFIFWDLEPCNSLKVSEDFKAKALLAAL